MKRTITHGPITVTVQMPDELPVEVADSLAVDIDLHADASEEQARAAIEALGGLAAFAPMRGFYSGSSGALSLQGAELASRPFEFTLYVPTGRERPVPDTPFLSELRAEQARLAAAAEVETAKAAS